MQNKLINFFKIALLLLSLSTSVSASTLAAENIFQKDLNTTKLALKEFRLIEARELLYKLNKTIKTSEHWFKMRDLIHQHPYVGQDILMGFDKTSPFKLNNVDLAIRVADKLMLEKKFLEAANIYQNILKRINKNKKFKSSRNYQLYWSIVHSLARSLYAMKQFDDAFILYRSISSSYPYYKQVQFELMWNNYMNNRLEYALGAIATMASGHFSKMLEPEVYLVQYYIYRRMCRDEETELIKNTVRSYQHSLSKSKLPFTSWIKKEVETLVYRQILQSGTPRNKEQARLYTYLDRRMSKDVKRIQGEFDLISAHLDLDSGKNKNLKPVKELLTIDQLLANSNEKWTVEDSEIWLDELGKQVFIQKSLCK